MARAPYSIQCTVRQFMIDLPLVLFMEVGIVVPETMENAAMVLKEQALV